MAPSAAKSERSNSVAWVRRTRAPWRETPHTWPSGICIVHRTWARRIGGTAAAWLPTGFDETGTQREVILFELSGDAPAGEIQRLAMRPFRPYRRLHGKLADVEQAIDRLAVAEPDQPTPWCEAVVELDGPRPGLAPALVDRCQARGWNLVSVRRQRPTCERAGLRTTPRLGLHEVTPEDVFVRRHEDEYGGPPDDELLAEFRSLVESLDDGSATEEIGR